MTQHPLPTGLIPLPLPALQPIRVKPRRPNPDAWPPEVAAEMQAIYEGREP